MRFKRPAPVNNFKFFSALPKAHDNPGVTTFIRFSINLLNGKHMPPAIAKIEQIFKLLSFLQFQAGDYCF